MTKKITKAIRTVRNFNEEKVQPLFFFILLLIILVSVTVAVLVTIFLMQ